MDANRTSRPRLRRAMRLSGQAGQTALDTPPETLASELCSDRASDTLRDGEPPRKAAALLTFVLFEAYQPDRWV
jgi:hypothetical protein